MPFLTLPVKTYMQMSYVCYVSKTPPASIFSDVSGPDAAGSSRSFPFKSGRERQLPPIKSTAGAGEGDASKVSYLSKCDDF